MAEKTKECPSCAFDVPAEAETCPFCGYEYPVPKAGVGTAAWVFAALLALPVLWVLVRLFG